MKVVKGGVSTPKGFKSNGISCGIKRSGKPDLALIVSDVPATSAGLFTKNSVKAAPLVISLKHIRNGKIQAIVCNSGNANCFTGKFGLLYAEQTTQVIANLLDINKQDVLVSSTGIIGKPLPFQKIKKNCPKLVRGLHQNNSIKAAKAIMTTDIKIKQSCVTFKIDNKKITIGACAKGSGMVAPNMATMLAFISTDVHISSKMLKMALKSANEHSFNSITIDGCMSTNDMLTVMANGKAQNQIINIPGKSFNSFSNALNYVCLDLAKQIVLDAEGASKFIEINVSNARTYKQAKQISLIVANSNLVKTAAFGNNPNWGRVVAAVGSLGIKNITEENLKINFSSFQKKNISINIDLSMSQSKATVYTSDLSYEYVKINGEYN